MIRAFKTVVVCIAFSTVIACGGGGGGGSSAAKNVTLSGDVLLIDTLQPTSPPSSVAISGKSAATDATTGSFSLTVPAGATSATATYVPTGGSAEVFSYTFPAATTDSDLGDLFVGAQTVSMKGRLVDSSTSTPIPGGSVGFEGRTATTAADGTFVLTNLAYPASNLSGFLSLQGVASALSHFNSSFQANGNLVSGVVTVGDIALVPSGSNSPPGFPADAIVTVKPISAGVLVTVLNGSSQVTSGTTDASGTVQFWLPVGTYTLQATQGSKSGSGSITINQLTQQSTANIQVQ